jgi:putative hemolysin
MILPEGPSLDLFIRRVLQGSGSFAFKVPLLLENNRYILKTVSEYSELRAALRLRHNVFFAWGLDKKLNFEIDVDQFDLDSDHLVVIDKETSQVVGNYRVRCSLFHPKFYSEDEFVLNEFLVETEDNRIEIGRACIHPDYRTGAVIQLLWRGLFLYMRKTKARFLFGCSSISTRIPGQIEHVWNYLQVNSLMHPNLQVQPKHPFAFRDMEGDPGVEVELPPLLQSYIRSGAKVLGPPAFDPEFECADFFTLLDLNDLTERRTRRYEAALQPAMV